MQAVLHEYDIPPAPHSFDYLQRSRQGHEYHMLCRVAAQLARWHRHGLRRVHAHASLCRAKTRARRGLQGRPYHNPKQQLA